jgi:hypothetical protein
MNLEVCVPILQIRSITTDDFCVVSPWLLGDSPSPFGFYLAIHSEAIGLKGSDAEFS